MAATGTFAQALTVFDQALRMGADRDLMGDIVAGRRRRGAHIVRQALSFADARSESVGESWSRAQMIEGGIPLPRLQHRVTVRSATYVTDFDWDWLAVGEFDGLHKYGRLRRPGESVEDAVVREKLREDDIVGSGPRMVRWTWATLEAGELVALLRSVLRRVGLLAA